MVQIYSPTELVGIIMQKRYRLRSRPASWWTSPLKRFISECRKQERRLEGGSLWQAMQEFKELGFGADKITSLIKKWRQALENEFEEIRPIQSRLKGKIIYLRFNEHAHGGIGKTNLGPAARTDLLEKTEDRFVANASRMDVDTGIEPCPPSMA